MGYKTFEDLPVWRAAIDLAVRIFDMTSQGTLDRYAGLRSQIERAVVSVSNNIAEGFDWGTHDELITFLYYAMGSAGEVRSMLHLIERLPDGPPARPQAAELIPECRGVSRQLGGWLESLKTSGRLGPRHETEATRRARDQARRRTEFLDKLDRIKNREEEPPTE